MSTTDPLNTQLDGDGYPQFVGAYLQISPNGLELGNLQTTIPYTSSVLMTNTGDEQLIVTSVVSDHPDLVWDVSNFPLILNAGETYTEHFTVTPSALGLADSTSIFQVTYAVNNPYGYEIVWTGANTLAISATAIEFSNTESGQVSAEQLITVTNTGSASITISALTPPTDFILGPTQPTLPVILATNGTFFQFGVQFAPLGEGYFKENLQIVNTAPSSPFLLSLVGTGYLITPAFIITNQIATMIYAWASSLGAVVVDKLADPFSYDSDANCTLTKLQNFALLGVNKLVKWFWLHYEDLGVVTYELQLSNPNVGNIQSYVRVIGTLSATGNRNLDQFEVVMEGEDISITIVKLGGDGPLSVEDYGLRYLPQQEMLGTDANPLTVVEYATFLGTEVLIAAFGDGSIQSFDEENFDTETVASQDVSNTVLLPFPTQYGQVPGFTYEKQVMRVWFHYENYGVAVVRVNVTSMRGDVSTQDVTIGTVGADQAVDVGIADIVVTDEVVNIQFQRISGPIVLVDWTAQYTIKGERAKQAPTA